VFGLLKSIITLAILGSLAVCGATVKLGDKTFFGHVARIWSTDETQDLVKGVKKTSGPVMDKVKRGVQAGYDEFHRNDDPGQPDAGL
jgi:hypothetical protein